MRLIIVAVGIASFMAFSPADAGQPRTTALILRPAELSAEIRKEFERHNYKKVIQLYEEYASGRPDEYIPLTVRVLYSQSLADTGEIDGAIKNLREVLSDLPPQLDLLKLHYDLANLLVLQKKFDEARLVFQKILASAGEHAQIASKVRERMGSLKGKDLKKDFASLQLLDIETALEAGEVPDAAETLLKQIIDQNPNSPQAEQARLLQSKLEDVRTQKAKALLDEARRLFDEERKYPEVREILERLRQSYTDVCEMTSVDALQKAIDTREGKSKRP